jgi:hypothetical protein
MIMPKELIRNYMYHRTYEKKVLQFLYNLSTVNAATKIQTGYLSNTIIRLVSYEHVYFFSRIATFRLAFDIFTDSFVSNVCLICLQNRQSFCPLYFYTFRTYPFAVVCCSYFNLIFCLFTLNPKPYVL